MLIVSALLLSGFTIVSTEKFNSRKGVLSESDGGSGGGGSGGDHGGSSGESSGTSSKEAPSRSNTTVASTEDKNRFNLQQTLRVREPEATEKPETIETPEPRGIEGEFENEVETEIKDGTGEAKIKLHKGNAFQFEQEGLRVQVQGQTPISVNPTTRELTITTPEGTKVVTTLPNQALQNLVENGVLSTQSGINLTTDANGNPVYEINGVRYEKLLGLFTIAIDKTGQVSAQNGQIVGVSQSPLSRFLDLLSI